MNLKYTHSFRHSQRSKELSFSLSAPPEGGGSVEGTPSRRPELRTAVDARVQRAEGLVRLDEDLNRHDEDALRLLAGLKSKLGATPLFQTISQKLENKQEYGERVAQEEYRRELWKYQNASRYTDWMPLADVGKAYGSNAFMYKCVEKNGVPVLASYIPALDNKPDVPLLVLDLATGVWARTSPSDCGLTHAELQAEYARNPAVQQINGNAVAMRTLTSNTVLEDELLKNPSARTRAGVTAFDAARGSAWNQVGTRNEGVRARLMAEPVPRTRGTAYRAVRTPRTRA